MELAQLNMLNGQLLPVNVHNAHLLQVIKLMKRERFVPKQYKAFAYADVTIPLYAKQTMLTPQVEAKLLQALDVNKQDKVLEIGTGSGYITAILARCADFVYSLEINADMQKFASDNLLQAGINNVQIIAGDGTIATTTPATFNKIFIGGGLVSVPKSILDKLAVGGTLVAIVGTLPVLNAVCINRTKPQEFITRKLFDTVVPYLISTDNTLQLKHEQFNWN